MKKKILIGSAIILGVIALLGVVLYITVPKILFSQVDRVEFWGQSSCDGPMTKTVVLSDSEAWRTVLYYNIALYQGDVMAEGCDSDFTFNIFLKNGNRIRLIEAYSPRIEVEATGRDQIWVNSALLTAFAQELIVKYGLF